MTFAASMLIAMAIDAAFGWPDALYRRIGHPVTWIGRLISLLEKRWNGGEPDARRLAGITACLLVVLVTVGAAIFVLAILPSGVIGMVIAGALAWPFLAIRSMYDHVAAVNRPLSSGDLDHARVAVAMIVGRDPAQLEKAGVARAGLESLAENTSDGVVAPLFWGLLLGLPGIAAYKAINTLDSMIGHRTEKFEAFGWASARLDDLVNLIPARLTGALFALVSSSPVKAFRIMWRDAGHHRSPNAGWPEAAVAGALDVRLSGPRTYGDRISEEPWINAGCPDPVPQDLSRGLALYLRLVLALFVLTFIVTVLE